MGGEKYTLYVKDLESGKQLLSRPIKWVERGREQAVSLSWEWLGAVGRPRTRSAALAPLLPPLPALRRDTAGNFAWANDNKTLFYVTKDKLDRCGQQPALCGCCLDQPLPWAHCTPAAAPLWQALQGLAPRHRHRP